MAPRLPSHIWQIRGSEDGPNTLILGGTHGDEHTGIALVRAWLKAIDQERNLLLEPPGVFNLGGITGSLFLGFGNMEAILRDNRSATNFRDLNRCFEPSLLADTMQSWADLERARELLPFLLTIDLMIDVHAMSEHDSKPIICFGSMTPRHQELLPFFPVRYIITDPDGVLGGAEGAKELATTDQAVNRARGTALCYETGHFHDMSKIPLAQTVIVNVLEHKGIIDQVIRDRLLPATPAERDSAKQELKAFDPSEQRRLKLVAFVSPLQPSGIGFTFEPGMQTAWTYVYRDQLYGRYADGQPVFIPADGFLVFPSPPERMDRGSLFYIAQDL